MRDEILKLLKESEVPLTELNIQDKLSEKVSLDKLCEELRTMEKCGDLYVTKKGKYTFKSWKIISKQKGIWLCNNGK